MNAAGAEGGTGLLSSWLVGGSSSCEARLRLLERRLTGQPGDHSNGASLAGVAAPQNLASGFDAVAGAAAAAVAAAVASQPAAGAGPGAAQQLQQMPASHMHAAVHGPAIGNTGSQPLGNQHALDQSGAIQTITATQTQLQLPAKRGGCGRRASGAAPAAGAGTDAAAGTSKRRRVTAVAQVTAIAATAVAGELSAPAATHAPGHAAEALAVPASPATNRGSDEICQTPGNRGTRQGANGTVNGAGAGPAPRSPYVGKPAPRSGGGSKAQSAAAARGQTKLNSFFPTVENTNSRDSEGSAGPAMSGPGATAAAAERAAAAAAAALQGAGPGAGGSGAGAGMAAAPGRQLAMVPEAVGAEQLAVLQQRLEAREQEVRQLQEELRQQSQQLQVHQQSAGDVTRLRQANEMLQQQWSEALKAAADREERLRAEISRTLKAGTRSDRELQKLRLALGSSRLGGVAVQRTGPMQIQEVWEDGPAAQALAARLVVLGQQREELEAARKALRKKLAPPPSARERAAAAAAAAAATGGEGTQDGSASVVGTSGQQTEYMSGAEFVTMDEIYKLRLAALKREEEAVKAEEERLNTEKVRHVRLLKRLRDEECSRFGGLSLLAQRYQLLNLLGKGGFSEVYKAYDLQELKYVACKIHQLNPHWSEAKKQSYVKHAVREYKIHEALRHQNIVNLLDIHEIDTSSFATFLDLCEGPDLDSILREHGALPEKEARAIIAQVFSALVYLNQPSHRIIHYDLKPANILFDSLGLAKVTDFGLSKVVEEGQTMGMELTSQGAGTYWYLPPECFELGGPGQGAPRISNKVDVWSAGVILYQMLYGRRPFGEGMTQEQILRDRVMLNAREVEFPSKPSVSADAKEFIRKCLAHRQEMRWDVLTAAQDPYLCLTKQAAAAATAAQQQQQQQQQAALPVGGVAGAGITVGVGLAVGMAANGRRGAPPAPTGFRGLLTEMIGS